jgi:hypothetical protein
VNSVDEHAPQHWPTLDEQPVKLSKRQPVQKPVHTNTTIRHDSHASFTSNSNLWPELPNEDADVAADTVTFLYDQFNAHGDTDSLDKRSADYSRLLSQKWNTSRSLD